MDAQNSERSGSPLPPLQNMYTPYDPRQVTIQAAPYVLVQTPAGLVPSLAVNPSGGQDLPLGPLTQTLSMSPGSLAPTSIPYPVPTPVAAPTATTTISKKVCIH